MNNMLSRLSTAIYFRKDTARLHLSFENEFDNDFRTYRFCC